MKSTSGGGVTLPLGGLNDSLRCRLARRDWRHFQHHADRSANDFGVNFGGGITLGTEARFYIEARYHYVWGPYFPLTFGFRF